MKSYVIVNEKGEALRANYEGCPRAFTAYDQYVGRSVSKAQAQGVLARAKAQKVEGVETATIKPYNRNDFC